jgi:hypothetical protein
MKNSSVENDDELRPEYDLSSLRVRKVGPGRTASGQHGVLLEPDVAAVFPDSHSVNEALRFLIRVTKSGDSGSPTSSTRG